MYSFDGSGRLWSAFGGGVTHRRGLNGRVMAKRTLDDGVRARRWLTDAEADELVASTNATAREVAEALRSGAARLNSRMDAHAERLLARACAFDVERARDDAAAYARVYQPVGILPPDQYLSVVLQLTEGCSFNTCTFCSFYRDRAFRIKRPDEFRAHARDVRGFLGDGLGLRRSIFLGDANALVAPMPLLLPLMDAAGEVFDARAMGVYAFLDGFSGERKSADDYALLAARGLRRVYIGLESGNAELLAFLRKPGAPDDALHAARAMKSGGVAVGVIVLVGAGGHAFAEAHTRDTIALLNAMPLDGRDIVYFSELVATDDLPYARDARDAGLSPLTPAECAAQATAIKSRLRFGSAAPKMSAYDIREFVY